MTFIAHNKLISLTISITEPCLAMKSTPLLHQSQILTIRKTQGSQSRRGKEGTFRPDIEIKEGRKGEDGGTGKNAETTITCV